MMSRTEYIEGLRQQLQGLPESEITDIIYDYQEHFEIGLTKGKSEDEIAQELGSPKQIAQSYRGGRTAAGSRTAPTLTNQNQNLFGSLLIGLALVFFNIIFLLGPYLGVVGIVLGLLGVALGFTFGGVATVVAVVLQPIAPAVNVGVHPLTAISLGVGMGALGVLLLIGGGYLIKLLFDLTLKYLRWNIDVVTK